tara:strand:+ start:283 stop:1095 length:813 start_codon:yes stop_codon:yes gene_type:complete
MKEKISILGIGWLGLPLAKKLTDIGYNVKGSTTSKNKLELLESNEIQPFQIELSQDNIIGNIEGFLAEADVLIINIPPKLRGNSSESFVEKIKLLIAKIEKLSVKKVLFISSTSVYADAFPIVTINENIIPNPDSESGKQLLQTEDLLLLNKSFQTTILRFGGLLAEDRHPIKFLSGRSNVENPDAPVNLIHQKDCIGIIVAILKQNKQGNDIYNAVAPQHPTKKKYYHKKAENSNLPLPIFTKNKVSKGKLISSVKIETGLSYKFKYII